MKNVFVIRTHLMAGWVRPHSGSFFSILGEQMQELNFLEIDLVSGGTDMTSFPGYPETETGDVFDHDWTKPDQER